MNASTYKSGTEPRTVADLLLELQNSDRGFRMQKYAANEIARFFKMQINAIRLEMLRERRRVSSVPSGEGLGS